MSRRLRNKIFKEKKKLEKECRRSKMKKIGKRVVFLTLTATMLVNALPIHQSSITLGKVFAEEGRTNLEALAPKTKDKELEKFELSMAIDKIAGDLETKLEQIISDKKNPEIEEDRIYEEIDKISDKAKKEILEIEDINAEKIKNEFEKEINNLLDDVTYIYHLDSKMYISESDDGSFELIGEKLPLGYNSFTYPMEDEEYNDSYHMETMNHTTFEETSESMPEKDEYRVDTYKETGERSSTGKKEVVKEDVKVNLEKLKEQKAMMEKMKAKAIAKALSNKQRIRVAGKNRRETALGISRMKFNSSNKIILVNQDSFADSLTASVLAEKLNVPILLTDRKTVSAEVLLEMQRLKTSEVLILGGESSVSKGLEEKLRGMNIKVERLAGSDRYETSALVAEKVYKFSGKNKGAVIASGEDYPDALAIAPVAARDSQPILLVKNNEIPEKIEDILVYNSVKEVTIVGGERSVSANVENKLKTRNLTRISGKDRYDTATKIATEKFRDPHAIYIATGENFADALTAGPVAATTNAPILLVNKNGFTRDLKTYIDKSKAFALIFLGGEASIPKSFEDKLAMIGDEKSRAEAEIKLEKAKRMIRSDMEKLTILGAEEKEMLLKEVKEATDENDIKYIISKLKKFEDLMKKKIEAEKENKEKNKADVENKGAEASSETASIVAK